MFTDTDEAGRLAPIVVVMLPEAERKAGSPFLNCFTVSL